jgi:hypothetical protein
MTAGSRAPPAGAGRWAAATGTGEARRASRSALCRAAGRRATACRRRRRGGEGFGRRVEVGEAHGRRHIWPGKIRSGFPVPMRCRLSSHGRDLLCGCGGGGVRAEVTPGDPPERVARAHPVGGWLLGLLALGASCGGVRAAGRCVGDQHLAIAGHAPGPIGAAVPSRASRAPPRSPRAVPPEFDGERPPNVEAGCSSDRDS